MKKRRKIKKWVLIEMSVKVVWTCELWLMMFLSFKLKCPVGRWRRRALIPEGQKRQLATAGRNNRRWVFASSAPVDMSESPGFWISLLLACCSRRRRRQGIERRRSVAAESGSVAAVASSWLSSWFSYSAWRCVYFFWVLSPFSLLKVPFGRNLVIGRLSSRGIWQSGTKQKTRPTNSQQAATTTTLGNKIEGVIGKGTGFCKMGFCKD